MLTVDVDVDINMKMRVYGKRIIESEREKSKWTSGSQRIFVLFGGTAAGALAGLFYMASEMCKVIGYDSFSELPGTPSGRAGR